MSSICAAYPVVPPRAAAKLETCHAGRQIELVVYHEYLVCRNLVEARQLADRLAAVVHEGVGRQQPHVAAADAKLRGTAGKPGLALECRTAALQPQRERAER